MMDGSTGNQQQHQNGDGDIRMDARVASTSATEERPSTPDRPDFERQLSALNDQINASHQELNALLGKHGMESELRKLTAQLREKKLLRETEKKFARDQEPEIENIRKELVEKGKIISDLENNDLFYKKEERLDAKMKELEDRYNSKRFTNVRDEQALVKEIDKLKRNKAKLAKYVVAIEQRKALEDRLKVCQDIRKKAYTNAKRAHNEYKSLQLKQGAMKIRIENLRSQLSRLYPKKSLLLDAYNKERASYMRWSSQIKQSAQIRLNKSASLPSSRSKYIGSHRKPSVSKTMDSDGELFDDEKLEPFHEQKTRCRRLITYLQSLLHQLDAPALAELHTELDDQTIEKLARPPLEKAPSSDSADDLPDGFTRLRRPTTADTPPVPASSQSSQLAPPLSPKHKKRGSKKSSKKATQPISHSVELYQSFAELGVEVPSAYQAVPMALKAVTERLAFFEHQTNLPNAEDPLDPYGLRDLHFEYPPSESDVTSDSGAWGGSFYSTDRSESASQFSLSQSAVVSPGDPADGVRPLSSFFMSPPVSPTDDVVHVPSRSGALPTREQLHQRTANGLTAADKEHVITALKSVALARQPTSDEGIDASGYGSKESSANSSSAPVLGGRQSSGVGMEEPPVRH